MAFVKHSVAEVVDVLKGAAKTAAQKTAAAKDSLATRFVDEINKPQQDDE